MELAYSFGFWLGDGSTILTLVPNGQLAKIQVTIANAFHEDMYLHQLHLGGGHIVTKKSYSGGEASAEWRFAAGEEVRFFARYAKGFEAFGQSAKSLARIFNLEEIYRLNAAPAAQVKDSALYDDWRRLLIIWDPELPRGVLSPERRARCFHTRVQGFKAELLREGKALPATPLPPVLDVRSFAEGGQAPLCNYFHIHSSEVQPKVKAKAKTKKG